MIIRTKRIIFISKLITVRIFNANLSEDSWCQYNKSIKSNNFK